MRPLPNYDLTVAKAFPELAAKFPNSPFASANLAQLITHTAGLPRTVGPSQNAFSGDGKAWRYEVAKAAFNNGSVSNHNRSYAYSNSGIDIAVAAVERVSGQTFESWMVGETAKKLGLMQPRSMKWSEYPKENDVVPYYLKGNQCVLGQLKLKGSYQPQDFYTPHGSVSLTIEDLCRFAQYTMNNSSALPDEVYQRTIHEQSELSPQTYAGWMGKVQWINHAGDTARGEYCYLAVNTKLKRAILFYSNANYEEPRPANRYIETVVTDLFKLGAAA